MVVDHSWMLTVAVFEDTGVDQRRGDKAGVMGASSNHLSMVQMVAGCSWTGRQNVSVRNHSKYSEKNQGSFSSSGGTFPIIPKFYLFINSFSGDILIFS